MREGLDIAYLASLIGDPTRANMLAALMSGHALTAGELAAEAGVTAQTGSSHLAKLIEARLLSVENQGRHRYYRIAGPELAEAIEAVMGLAARLGGRRTRPGPKDPALRRARLCYDHLAGAVATGLYQGFVARGLIIATPEGIGLSTAGHIHFTGLGLDVAALAATRRPLCRACLDWSERRHHLAGGLGAALARLAFEHNWLRRIRGSRALAVTPAGLAALTALAVPAGEPADPADMPVHVLVTPES